MSHNKNINFPFHTNLSKLLFIRTALQLYTSAAATRTPFPSGDNFSHRVDLVGRSKLDTLERVAGLCFAIFNPYDVETIRGEGHHSPIFATHKAKPR